MDVRRNQKYPRGLEKRSRAFKIRSFSRLRSSSFRSNELGIVLVLAIRCSSRRSPGRCMAGNEDLNRRHQVEVRKVHQILTPCNRLGQIATSLSALQSFAPSATLQCRTPWRCFVSSVGTASVEVGGRRSPSLNGSSHSRRGVCPQHLFQPRL
jgi:hypothetical protein